MKKQNILFFLIIILLIVLVLLFNNKADNNITGNVAFENNSLINSFSSETYDTIPPWEKRVYIVQFKEPAIYSLSVQSEEALDRIDSQHQNALRDIKEITGISESYSTESTSSADNIIIAEYKYVFNGMALNLSLDELMIIEDLPYVKSVELSKTYYIALNESIPLINADDVWDLVDGYGQNITGKNVTIAILDTGIDYTHPDLGGCYGAGCKVVGGYNYFSPASLPIDDHGHGTHVAATAAGNGTYLKGVAPDADIFSYKVCNSGGSCYASYIMLALENASQKNCSIASLSIGGTGTPDDALSIAADNAVKNGMVVVIAAGNSGPSEGTIESPGNSRKAITVGASDKLDKIAAFSSRGITALGTLKPDVLAPGVKICAAEWDSAWITSRCYDSQHVAISGTSMATPHVSGVAALILQKHPDWTPIDVKMAIRNTAKDIGQKLEVQGFGRVDALAAVNLTSKPCTAEFYTYNTTYIVGGNVSLKGTAQCEGFKNYSVYLSSDFSTSSGNVTQFYSGGNFVDELNFSFSGNEIRNAYFKIPKLVNIASASLKIEGFDNGLSFPYKLRIDFSDDGDADWISYQTVSGNEEIGGVDAVGSNYAIWQNKTVAQSFNWSGGEIAAISVFIQRRKSGDGLLLEIRNNTNNIPSDLIKSVHIPYEKVSSTAGWNVFDIGELNLSSGQYWFVIKLFTREYGDYTVPYTVNSHYTEGKIAYSNDYGQTWGSMATQDLSFRIHNFGYFNDSETISYSFFSELTDFLKSCSTDAYGNCLFPISINSTNGSLNLSDLNVIFDGIYSINYSFWNPICTGFSSVDENELCSIDTSLLEQKQYSLLLNVNGENSSSSDYLFKNIKHFTFSAPENNYLVKNGINVTISANGQFTFKNYTLDYKSVAESSWHVFKFATNKPGNGTLGYFNSTNLAEGVYVIRLTAHILNSSFTDQSNVTIRVDKKLHDGWPQELDFTVFASQKVADVDNDGNMEIIAVSTRSPYIFQSGGDYNDVNRSVYVFKNDGSLMSGWPRPTNGGKMWGRAPTIGDLDNDGDLEILAIDSRGERVVAYHHDGSVVSGWPQPNPIPSYYGILAAPSLYDLDNDGNLEVIFASFYDLYVYRSNGVLMWKTSNTSKFYGGGMYFPIVGDFNADGYGEILAYSDNAKKIYLFNYSGGTLPGWPYDITTENKYVGAIIAADIDDDYDLEIIFSQVERGIVALHHNNSAVEGWPANVEGNYVIDLVAADINEDDVPEVIVFPFTYGGWDSSKIFIFNKDGTNFTGFPYRLPNMTLSMRPTVGDIDGDSKMEMVVSSHNNIQVSPGVWWDGGVVFSFDTDNPGITSGFPRNMDAGPPYAQWARTQESAPTIADIDKDGTVEIIVGSAYYTDRNPLGAYSGGRVIIWDLGTPYDRSLIKWDQYGNNLYNTLTPLESDFDNINFDDNCPYDYNPGQEDNDSDGIGDACDNVNGNVSSVNTTAILNITIGGSTNLSRELSGSQLVNFYDNNTLFMNFTFNFTKAILDLTNVSIEKGTNGSKNYIIIRNLNITGTKTLYLQRLNSSSNAVCFIDSSTVLLSELMSNCTRLKCPGTNGSYSCVLSGSTFIVSGFSHTALIESYSVPVYVPPSDGDGGSSGGSSGGGGSSTIMVPPTQTVSDVDEENVLVEDVVETTSKTQQEETAPVTEKPVSIESRSALSLLPFMMSVIVIFILVSVVYVAIKHKLFKKRRK